MGVLKGDIQGSKIPCANNRSISGFNPLRPSRDMGYCLTLTGMWGSEIWILIGGISSLLIVSGEAQTLGLIYF